jgi:hypothetical protein
MLKEQIINKINTLNTEELMLLYGYLDLLEDRTPKPAANSRTAHMDVREALKGLTGSLSEDILHARDERL